jgi:hexosaminidase
VAGAAVAEVIGVSMKVIDDRLLMHCLVWLALFLSGQALAAAEIAGPGPSLIPVPLLSLFQEHAFLPGARVAVDLGERDSMPSSATWLTGLISAHTGREVVVSGPGAVDVGIRLVLESEAAMRRLFAAAGLAPHAPMTEAYGLSIGPDGVIVRAVGEVGLFYGMASLWQVLSALPPDAREWPGLLVLDAPEFAWRGLMLDSARHMQSVEFIKRYLDWMSLHKLNVFHWHLTDDQAWRLEIKGYPRLAAIGGFRVPAGAAPAADIDGATGKPRAYGGYYTQEQVREVVAHAAVRQITVVPEIDVPGHASAAIAAYPEVGVEGHGVDRVPASWGIFPNVFNLEESTFELLEGVLGEIVGLFPGPFIHLGGDEVETGQWARSERTRARMQELGIEDLQSVQHYYVERLQKFLDPHGRRVVGWDEILRSDLPPHAVVMSWRGVQGAIEAAAKGHETVLSPAPTLYLDHLQTTAADAPPGRGGIITVRDIYEFDPLPDRLGENRDRVLGLQGNLWTEHVRTEARAAYMTWPRAAAIAELGWSAPANRDWDDFARRLPDGVRRMQALGIAAASDAHALYRQPLPVSETRDYHREDRELELCSQAIVLALEDDAPLQGARESFLLDIQNPCWIWKDAPLESLVAIEAAVGQVPFNFEIGEAIHGVVVEPPLREHGELRVRYGGCGGPIIAEAPLAPAVANPAATQLAAAAVSLPERAAATADLCFSFTRSGVEPIWALDWVELVRAAP